MRRGRAVVLYSGGLDSLLAARLLMDQGVEVTGFHCVLPFVAPKADLAELKPSRLARQIGLKLHYYRCGDEYIKMVMNPPHGYGKFMNPCIDCKIFFIKEAARYMRETGADVVATGEVVGQRPMSQMRNTMYHIIKEAGIEGRLLRPLCAKLMNPTIPESEGLIDREQLLDINGRGRARQMELAERFGIKEYSSPAGGCNFADRFIGSRIKDLFKHHALNLTQTDLYLLTIGRHFRLSPGVKLIVGRNEPENIELEAYPESADMILIPDFLGPAAHIKGKASADEIKLAASIIKRYGNANDPGTEVEVFQGQSLISRVQGTSPPSEDDLRIRYII